MVVCFRGLRNGILTTRWPSNLTPTSTIPRRGGGRPAALDRTLRGARRRRGARPRRSRRATLQLDRGRCILCGRASPPRTDWFGGRTVPAPRSVPRRAVVSRPRNRRGRDAVARTELATRVRRLRRSVHLRHVDAGSDGSDEWEVQALTNPVYDLHRLGIFFTASPRHADILLVTGIGTAGMAEPLRRTLEASPARGGDRRRHRRDQRRADRRRLHRRRRHRRAVPVDVFVPARRPRHSACCTASCSPWAALPTGLIPGLVIAAGLALVAWPRSSAGLPAGR